ncbi:hypothetical protein [Amycolatopsis sp. 195334CR]|uniref:hypothetical protein n=1 Tax=Amycolatopsis sp. 195334CR TaxID=2814588 RepID=UPI001A8DD5FF|nr:hypothetical protein [Amycolatopsis sp. 195334CR]MBN6041187.1 hypothetical protein [Amycolatopsis sp. 195334CR]
MPEQDWEERVDAVVRAVRAEQPTPMTDSARTTAKARLTATLRGEPDTVVALAPRRRRGRNRWLPLAAAAAAVGVLGAGVVALSPGGDDTVSPAAPSDSPQASSVNGLPTYPPLPPVSPAPLNSAGRFAGQGSDLPQEPGQYLLVTTRTWNPHHPDTPERLEIGMGQEELRQEWIPADRAEEWQQSFDRDVHRPAPPPIPRNQPQPGQTSGTTSSEGTFVRAGGAYRHVVYLDPANFPADGRQLYEHFRNEANSRSWAPKEYLTEAIMSTLTRGDLTRDQRSLVYQALSYHPYLRILENVSTKDGRPAVAFGFDDVTGNLRREVLVDPVTTQVIGTRTLSLTNEPLNPKGGDVLTAKVGEVVSESALTYQVVGERGATQ